MMEPIQKKKKTTVAALNTRIVANDELNRQLVGRVTCSFCQSEGVKFEEVAKSGLGAE